MSGDISGWRCFNNNVEHILSTGLNSQEQLFLGTCVTLSLWSLWRNYLSVCVTSKIAVFPCVIVCYKSLTWPMFHVKQIWLCGPGSEGYTGIMVDYSGQTSMCQDWSCSNRSQQILSDVLGSLKVNALKADNGVTQSVPVGGHICSMC